MDCAVRTSHEGECLVIACDRSPTSYQVPRQYQVGDFVVTGRSHNVHILNSYLFPSGGHTVQSRAELLVAPGCALILVHGSGTKRGW